MPTTARTEQPPQPGQSSYHSKDRAATTVRTEQPPQQGQSCPSRTWPLEHLWWDSSTAMTGLTGKHCFYRTACTEVTRQPTKAWQGTDRTHTWQESQQSLDRIIIAAQLGQGSQSRPLLKNNETLKLSLLYKQTSVWHPCLALLKKKLNKVRHCKPLAALSWFVLQLHFLDNTHQNGFIRNTKWGLN